ncbi:GNAT family N-acetyltransferase [Marivita hallyeonensis]|uniref:Putative acetyltransferase n=1 Tax=Marivita hallyeonensis TaxID=996342 RepID=A0A1M5N7L3_9RHOB|nr:GNAT family N-acetyltransferase [Marivita hallyeonensis]SHG85467.1 putative acetyltransferase [Marivita hallyeonensis]
MTSFRIERVAEPRPDVVDLIERHFAAMRSQSPEESCHVLNADALFTSGAHIFVLRDRDDTLGMGAIKPLDEAHGELKSMHTKAEMRGRGIGNALVLHLLEKARALGLQKVSLETGSEDMFAPARRLYERHGFAYCPPFADYVEDPLSVFMTRTL